MNRAVELSLMTDRVIRSLREISNQEGTVTRYRLEDGKVVSSYDWKNDHHSRATDNHFPKGSIFPLHLHQPPTRETFIMQSGLMDVVCVEEGCEKRRIRLEPGDTLQLNPDEAHYLEALEESWMYAILIPPDPGMEA